jgi:hypothetical protein
MAHLDQALGALLAGRGGALLVAARLKVAQDEHGERIAGLASALGDLPPAFVLGSYEGAHMGAGGAASARRGQAGGATPRDADEPLLAASLGDADASRWALGILAERGLASQARPTVLGGLTRGSIAAA